MPKELICAFRKVHCITLTIKTLNTKWALHLIIKYVLLINKGILIMLQVFKNQRESAYLMLTSHLTQFAAKTQDSHANTVIFWFHMYKNNFLIFMKKNTSFNIDFCRSRGRQPLFYQMVSKRAWILSLYPFRPSPNHNIQREWHQCWCK